MRQLRYFVAIADCASISKAAAQLHIAQPALSQHVRRLERELNTALLDRTSRGVTPTDAGRRLYQSARSILAQVAQLPEFVQDAVANPVGEVRFGMSGTVSELVGVPLIEAVRRRYPGVRVRPVEAMSGYILEWLKRGDVDVALVYATSDPKGLSVRHALTEDLRLFGQKGARVGGAKPESTVPLATVLKLEIITPGLAHGLRELIESGAHKIGARVTPTLEIDSYRQIKQLVLRGAGFGILPETAVRLEAEQGLLDVWRIGRPALRRRVYLAHMSERPLSAATKVVSALAWEIIRDLVRTGVWAAQLPPNAERDQPLSSP